MLGGSGKNGLRVWLVLLAVAWTALVQAADYEREKKWADEISPAILVGDPIYLEQVNGHRFLGIFTPAAPAKGAVVVVHGLGVHPDWGLINALRSGLPERGYATLSIQMPVLAADAKGDAYPPLFPEAAERIAAAVAYLRGKKYEKIAIASHSMGARMADYFFAHTAHPRVSAWIAVGITAPFTAPGRIPVPVLDIYGEKDFDFVLQQAPARAQAIQAQRGSAQVSVAGSDHYFNGKEGELVEAVALFLNQVLR